MVEMTNADHAKTYRLMADSIRELAEVANTTNNGFNAAVGALLATGELDLATDVEADITAGVRAALELDEGMGIMLQSADYMVRMADKLEAV